MAKHKTTDCFNYKRLLSDVGGWLAGRQGRAQGRPAWGGSLPAWVRYHLLANHCKNPVVFNMTSIEFQPSTNMDGMVPDPNF